MIEASAAGNTEVFRALFNELEGSVFRFIRCRVPERDDALDVLQECFLDLWRSLRKGAVRYTSDREFHAYIYTIVRRKIARLYRFRRPTVSLEDLVDGLKGEDSDPAEAHHLINSLEKLNDEDREVVRLHYFSGLSFGEIAELLGKGESAIKVRHHRALEKLKRLLHYEKEL